MAELKARQRCTQKSEYLPQRRKDAKFGEREK
jgi:hypothetical protein